MVRRGKRANSVTIAGVGFPQRFIRCSQTSTDGGRACAGAFVTVSEGARGARKAAGPEERVRSLPAPKPVVL